VTNFIQTIRTLADIPGVSGDEGSVRDAILTMIRDRVERVEIDPLGNLIVYKKGKRTPKNKILLSAHMDEVGFIITHVEESGLLRFEAVGGIDSRVVVGKAVEVGVARIYGVIGTKALHQTEEKDREEPLKLDKLHIDIGARDAAEAGALVSPGDRAVFHSAFREIGDGNILSRALDDRAGCALLVELIRGDLPCDCAFSFTVQEETGCTGAVTAAYTVQPDIAIAVETTTASDIAGVESGKEVCRLGGGPVISFMDRGTVYDSRLYRLAMDTAKRHGIPAQAKEGVFGGNESRSLQAAQGGARTLAVSLPCRYIHSPSNMLRTADIDHTATLLAKLIEGMGDLAL
jgi:endoglucanase